MFALSQVGANAEAVAEAHAVALQAVHASSPARQLAPFQGCYATAAHLHHVINAATGRREFKVRVRREEQCCSFGEGVVCR